MSMDSPVAADAGAELSLPDGLDHWQASLGWQPREAQQQIFQQLYQGVLTANRQVNLTRITAPLEFWEKHLWDSLSGVAPWLGSEPPTALQSAVAQPVQQVIDIGTGAGFPGIPVAIACPNWQLTLLDSTRKKIQVVAALCEQLGLPNCQTFVNRAETLGRQHQHRGLYDLALVRAVSGANACAEYALPFLKVGGTAIIYRGQWSEAEQDSLKQVAVQLGGELTQVSPWETPLTHGVRHCVYLTKTTDTPAQYPRGVGVPAKLPLGEERAKGRRG